MNGHAWTALENGCGPEQMSGGDAELGADESSDVNVHRKVRGSSSEVKQEL